MILQNVELTNIKVDNASEKVVRFTADTTIGDIIAKLNCVTFDADVMEKVKKTKGNKTLTVGGYVKVNEYDGKYYISYVVTELN